MVLDIIVHSFGSGWSNILRFTSTDVDCCNIGHRVPAIFYNSDGYLHITNAIHQNGNKAIDYDIDLEKWYRIVLAQWKDYNDGRVREYFLIISISYYGNHLVLLHNQNRWRSD